MDCRSAPQVLLAPWLSASAVHAGVQSAWLLHNERSSEGQTRARSPHEDPNIHPFEHRLRLAITSRFVTIAAWKTPALSKVACS